MPRKSQRRKSDVKRSPEAPAVKSALIAPATHKPWRITAVCIVLAAATIFIYWGARTGDFLICDDNYYVLENQNIQHGLTPQSTEWAFTTFRQGNWHPLTWISHIIDWNLYGNNPAGHHMTNVYIHAVNAILLFLLLMYITGFLGRSAIVAFLFALHPAHVESVAWISERKDVLCTLFWLAALLAYVWYARGPSWKRYSLIVLSFACALMSKPMAVTLPFTLLLLDYWPLRRITFGLDARPHWLPSLWKLCVEKWLLFLMASASCIVTFIAQRASGAVAEFQGLSLWVRLCTAAISYCRYLRITFWPNPLTAYYYYDLTNINVLVAVLSAIALVLVTALCWKIRKQRPYCLFGWLWFLGTLVPVIGIVQVGEQVMAERYTYVPLIGLFIAVVWLVGDAVASSPRFKVGAQVLAVAVIVASALKTEAQVKLWNNSVTLFSHALEVDPRGALPNFSLGAAYVRLGKYDEAEEYLERALVEDPSRPLILSDSAICMMQSADRRNLPLAGQRLKQALRQTPDDTDILTNLALWSSLMKRPADEEMYSRKALAVSPDLTITRLYLADALRAQGKLDEAAQECRQVIALEPDDYLPHYDLGIILDKEGLNQEALKELRLSLSIKPDQAMAHSTIGRILMETHQLPQAEEEFTQALRLDPENAYLHNDFGVLLAQMGDFENAAGQFSDALRIDPAYDRARQNLSGALAQLKKR